MSTLTIQLDPVALREATTQAIMGTLTPEVRERVLREAISGLLAPTANSWERGKSPLQLAFDQAVTQVAREMTVEMVRKDPAVVAELAVLIKKTADQVLKLDPDKMAEKMADAFVQSIRSRD